jgi:hypothetical protein
MRLPLFLITKILLEMDLIKPTETSSLTGDLDFTKMVLVDIPQQGQVLQRMELSYIHTVEQLASVFPEYQGLRIPYQAAPNNVKDFFRIEL